MGSLLRLPLAGSGWRRVGRLRGRNKRGVSALYPSRRVTTAWSFAAGKKTAPKQQSGYLHSKYLGSFIFAGGGDGRCISPGWDVWRDYTSLLRAWSFNPCAASYCARSKGQQKAGKLNFHLKFADWPVIENEPESSCRKQSGFLACRLKGLVVISEVYCDLLIVSVHARSLAELRGKKLAL